MIDLENLGRIMEALVDDCDKCPLEKICDSGCCAVWQDFFEKKVKEDGVEVCRD